MNAKLRDIGETVDQLITVDLTARGNINRLYQAARKKQGDQPLTLLAAQELHKILKPDCKVIIATGLPIRGWLSPDLAETDGPIGAATLARGLWVGFQALPIILCEEALIPVMEASCRGAGMTVISYENIQAAKDSAYALPNRSTPLVVVQGFPYSKDKATKEADLILHNYKPTALIAIERMGANEKGFYHYGKGEIQIPDAVAKIDILFEKAKEQGLLTIGIGDFGNELGMGKIKETIKDIPFGSKCACPCASGLAPEFAADILIASTVSNWGAYGIEACLAALTGNMEILHSPETDLLTLQACIGAGAIDGLSGFCEPFQDGIPGEMCANLVSMLHFIVRSGLTGSKH
jgi:hypothetical protein